MVPQSHLQWYATVVFSASLLCSVAAFSGESVMPATYAQDYWNDDQRSVWNVVVQWNRAFAENDVEQYFLYIDDDITVITPANPYRVEGIHDDREEFEFSLSAGNTRVGYFQMMQPHIRVHGDVAVVIYYSRGSYGTDPVQTRYFKETNVLARQDGEWKIVHIHLSM